MSYTAYTCRNCDEFFYEPRVRHEREKEEFWGEPVFYVTRIELCPACSSEDIEEVGECEDCGLAAAMTGYDACGPCQAKREESVRLEEALLDIARTGAGA